MSKTWSKLTKDDLACIRETIASSGVRIHLVYTQVQCKARLWHSDGHTVGVAGGYGYDKGSAALIEALGRLVPEWLEQASQAYFQQPSKTLYGGIGLGSVRDAFQCAGFDYTTHEYKDGTIIEIATPEQTDRELAYQRKYARERAKDIMERAAKRASKDEE